MTAGRAIGAVEGRAETVILALCRVLLGGGRKDRGLLWLIVNGGQHEPRCPRGQWLSPNSPRPDGDPCSARCRDAHAALTLADRWLEANDAERPDLLAAEVAG